MADWLHRQRMILGESATELLKTKAVLIFGIGGVGGYALEAIVRAGIGRVILVDCDTVSETNINRQIIADTLSIGKLKTEVGAKRCKAINPDIEIIRYDVFADEENIPKIIEQTHPDYIIDAIDTVKSKLTIIKTAKEQGIPVISSMGTGSKLDPTRFALLIFQKLIHALLQRLCE